MILLLVLVVGLSCSRNESDPPPDPKQTAIDTADHLHPTEQVDTSEFEVTDSLIKLRNDAFPRPGGRVVNVMITGVDSRLGDNTRHADANHLVRFFVDSGAIEIISIPRDTYADAGFDDTTGLNKLTNVRANRGRREYLNAVSEITGVEPIHHYVEFGFSQAIGLLELLGYKGNAATTLRVLRARQTYRAGDFQRSYNQGRFIRRVLLTNIQRTDDLMADMALRAALMLVETDLTYEICSDLLASMRTNGFTDDPSRAWVRLEPPVVMRVQELTFSSEEIVALNAQIDERVAKLGLDSVRVTSASYEHRLDELIASAARDSARSPRQVIRKLKRPYEQRAWLQVTDTARRKRYRDRIGTLMSAAYTTVGDKPSADRVRNYLRTEEEVIEGK